MRSKLGVQVLGSVEGHAKGVSYAVPVQETDQQGALEANEWQAGEWAQVPQFRRQGSFTLQAPKPSRILLCPHRAPLPKHPTSPGAQRGRASRAHRSQACFRVRNKELTSSQQPGFCTEVRPVLRPALQLGHAGGWGRWAGQRTPTGAQQEGPALTLTAWSVAGHGPCFPPPAHAVQRGPGRTLPGLQSRGRAELCRDSGSRGSRALIPSPS